MTRSYTYAPIATRGPSGLREVVTVVEAAKLLGVTPARIRQYLSKDRIVGAYKVGPVWMVPLYLGIPEVISKTRGPRMTHPLNGSSAGLTKLTKLTK